MSNQDLICLSSDEDEPQKKKSKISPTFIGKLCQPTKLMEDEKKNVKTSIICLDSDEETDSENITDEETDSEDIIIVNNKENIETNGTTLSIEKDSTEGKPELMESTPAPSHSETKNEENQGIEENISTKILEDTEKESIDMSTSQNEVDIVHNDIDVLLSSSESLPTEAKKFLTTCRCVLQDNPNSKIIFKKFPSLIKLFEDLKDEIPESVYLRNFLMEQTKIAKESVNCCIVSFKDVYENLKMSVKSERIELSKSIGNIYES
ncbi:hypothetical protein HHI36_004678 [Cryptolaemus montrouzieri]|uniref:Uncharacterized protein n=1 Tax=Cryptolaemus montrouzieri TaxID=559131 RepID=A0ABD2NSJ6_9CUCU